MCRCEGAAGAEGIVEGVFVCSVWEQLVPGASVGVRVLPLGAVGACHRGAVACIVVCWCVLLVGAAWVLTAPCGGEARWGRSPGGWREQ